MCNSLWLSCLDFPPKKAAINNFQPWALRSPSFPCFFVSAKTQGKTQKKQRFSFIYPSQTPKYMDDNSKTHGNPCTVLLLALRDLKIQRRDCDLVVLARGVSRSGRFCPFCPFWDCSRPGLKFVKEFLCFPCLSQGIGKTTIPKNMRNGPPSPPNGD